MKTDWLFHATAGLLSGIALSSCSMPAAPPATGDTTGPGMKAEVLRDQGPRVKAAALKADPGRYEGRVVQLGGDIVKTDVGPDGTLLLVHELPIADKPLYRPSGTSGGSPNFAVLYKGKLRPMDAAVGNRVLVIGVMDAVRPLESPTGAAPIPRIVAKCVAIWETAGEGVYHYIYEHGGDQFYPQIEQDYCALTEKQRAGK